jgi:3-isopropylmalate/(R)-2-methylmalate dehydratase small subunit
MEPISTFASTVAVLARDDIDTDQIIPARFLTTTDRSRLDEGLFADWRYDADGAARPDFALNKPAARGAQILLAGRNFGCGSSREHAVWALQACGFRAVISTEFADIFRNNALGNGLLPIELTRRAHAHVLRLCATRPGTSLGVDLQAQRLTTPSGIAFTFPIDAFAKHCLLNGTDAFGYLLSVSDDIDSYEASHAR